jgi:tRNASer (uridine44-2'-O)-methyltransferase
MVPEVETEEQIPYYHPKLQALAFHYTEITHRSVFDDDSNQDSTPSSSTSSLIPEQPPIFGRISISILPFPQESNTITTATPSTNQVGTADKVLPNRTYRTCLHLLETVHKHSYGKMVGYQKRVIHDVRI